MLPSLPTILIAVAAFTAIVGLILIAERFLRTGAIPRRGEGALTAMEVLALDPARRLHLVRCGDRQVLLLTGGAQDVVVGWLPGPVIEI